MSHNPQKYISQELLVRALLPCRVSRLEKRRGVASALGRRTVLIRSCGPATTNATWEDMKGACEELLPMLSRGIGARDGRNATRDRRQREVVESVMGSVMRIECGGTSRNPKIPEMNSIKQLTRRVLCGTAGDLHFLTNGDFAF